MKQLKLTSSLLLATLLFACTGQRSASTTFDKNASTERAISDLLSKMTLDEKIGQMTLFTTDWGSTGPTIRPGYEGDIRQGRCGALFNSHTAAFTRKLQKIAVEESRLKIPLLFGYDVIHGYKTIFPMPLGEAASWDLQAIEKAAEVAAAEASAAGLHWTFAPMCDVSRDPRWGRVMEGAGEDTYLGSEIARARVRGFQGKSFENADRVLACVKHYAGYGAPIAGRDYNVVDMTERTLREVYLPPYKAAVEEGAWTVMTSFNEIDGTPATANSWLLEDVLRGEWKFKGMVVSDYTSVNEMVNHGNVANEKEAGEAALNAGLDMDMQGAVFQNHLAKSVQEGKVKMVQIDEAVRRILRLKHQLGLFENPYKYCDEERERRVVLSQANQDAARDVARKSVVLLKNDNVLPLSKNLGSVAVIGPLADDKDQMIGAWSGAGEGQHCVTLLQGVRDKLGSSGKATVHYAKGCELTGDSRNGFADAIAAAKRSDVVIIAIGEHKDWSGEAACRADITVPAIQEELVRQILTAGKPVVVVLMNGRPLVIPWLSENSPALVEAWYLGTQAGNALADVLFGDYNPSGKLPITFPRHQGQVPIFYSEKNTGRPYDPNSKWNSRYLDVPNTPLYPFGFGLSYTTFSYSEPKVDKASFKKGQALKVTVMVENTGKVAGEETVQLYVRDLVGSVTRPLKELKGFRKISLKPGEKKEVSFTLGEKELAFYTKNMEFKAEAGEFDIMVGGNSQEVKKVRVRLTE